MILSVSPPHTPLPHIPPRIRTQPTPTPNLPLNTLSLFTQINHHCFPPPPRLIINPPFPPRTAETIHTPRHTITGIPTTTNNNPNTPSPSLRLLHGSDPTDSPGTQTLSVALDPWLKSRKGGGGEESGLVGGVLGDLVGVVELAAARVWTGYESS